ncbi:MAG: CHAT domain-containing tetratricopeptide repeat protein, partial [Pontixanthobacter sp.]
SQGTLAKVLLQSDRYEEAEAPARRALDIMAAKLGPDNRNTLAALHNLGVILARLGRFEEALELLTGRYDLLEKIGPGDSVNSLVSASNAAAELGRIDLAMEYGAKAAAVAGELSPEHRNALKGLTVLALRQDEARDYVAARKTIEAVASRRLAAGDTDIDPTLEVQRGLFAIRTGDIESGWARVEAGFEALEGDLLDRADQAELGADLASYYEPILQVVEAAFAADRPDAALHAFELASWGVNARSRQLLALKTKVAGNLNIAAKIDEFDAARARLRILNRERASLLAGDKVQEAEERAAEIVALKAHLAVLRTDIADAVPDFGQWLRPDVPTIAGLQARLTSDQALLIVMPSRNRTFSMVISADRAVMAESSQGRPTVRPLVAKLRAALDSNTGLDAAFPSDAAAELYNIVLPGQSAAVLEGKTRVAVVTSDALSRLPFGLLLSKAPEVDQSDFKSMDWLVKKHAFSIALTPSSAFTDTNGKMAFANFFGVGAPSLNGSSGGEIDTRNLYRAAQISFDDIRALPALPATAGEIAEVANALGSGNRITLTGDDATEQRVRDEGSGDYAVALFATHGLLGGEIGGLREPALVLTPPVGGSSADNDGLLQASEIASLGLRADFVILSACNSAAGRNDTAPAYTGLANAFLGSGSGALMLSHWRVRDDAAAYLSVNTVKHSQPNVSRAEALRQAQLDILNGTAGLVGGANPSVWAPFVVIEN